MTKDGPMFDAAHSDFSWECPWETLEDKALCQDIIYWILSNIIRPPSVRGIYEFSCPRRREVILLSDIKDIYENFPKELNLRWAHRYNNSENFSDKKTYKILEEFTPIRDDNGNLKQNKDKAMEFLFANISYWSDAVTIEDLLPQLASGRLIAVYDEYKHEGMPLNVIAEHVLYYKRPIRSDEQQILARALIDLGWKRHRTAQARRWRAPPDFPTRDPNRYRWCYR